MIHLITADFFFLPDGYEALNFYGNSLTKSAKNILNTNSFKFSLVASYKSFFLISKKRLLLIKEKQEKHKEYTVVNNGKKKQTRQNIP